MIREIIKNEQEEIMKELRVECKKEFEVDLYTNKQKLISFTDFDKKGNIVHYFSEDEKIRYYHNDNGDIISIISSKGDANKIICFNYNKHNELESTYVDGKKSNVLDIENGIKYIYNENNVLCRTNKYDDNWNLIEEIRHGEPELITRYQYNNKGKLIRSSNAINTIDYGYDMKGRLIYINEKQKNSDEYLDTTISHGENSLTVYETEGNEHIGKVISMMIIKLNDDGLITEMSIYDGKNKLQEKTIYKYEFYN